MAVMSLYSIRQIFVKDRVACFFESLLYFCKTLNGQQPLNFLWRMCVRCSAVTEPRKLRTVADVASPGITGVRIFMKTPTI
jgi:hypothetical protein